MGCTTKDINIAARIPIMEIVAKECNAGCFANIKTPTPKIVVKTDRIIEVLWVAIDKGRNDDVENIKFQMK